MGKYAHICGFSTTKIISKVCVTFVTLEASYTVQLLLASAVSIACVEGLWFYSCWENYAVPVNDSQIANCPWCTPEMMPLEKEEWQVVCSSVEV